MLEKIHPSIGYRWTTAQDLSNLHFAIISLGIPFPPKGMAVWLWIEETMIYKCDWRLSVRLPLDLKQCQHLDRF